MDTSLILLILIFIVVVALAYTVAKERGWVGRKSESASAASAIPKVEGQGEADLSNCVVDVSDE